MAEVAPGTSKIFVRYRSAKPSEDEMRDVFSKHGTITHVNLYGKFCFIEYDSETAAQLAVAAENGTMFKDVALEVETVVRNLQKRKGDETVVKVSASSMVATSELQETLSADVTAKKPKQEVSLPAVPTKNSNLDDANEVKSASGAGNALNDEGCQAMAEESNGVSSSSSETPNLGEDPRQLSRTQRRSRARKLKAEADKKTLLARKKNLITEKDQYPELSSQSPQSSLPYDGSGYLPAGSQTYTTAFPRTDLQIYSSNYAAECSQVSNSCAVTSYYNGHETTDVSCLKQTEKPGLTQSHRARNDLLGLHEGNVAFGKLPGSGKRDLMDRPQFPDLVNYSSAYSNARPVASDLKRRELKDQGPRSDVEIYRTSLARATTSSARVLTTSCAEVQGHQRSDSTNNASGICELIIAEPYLRQYGLKVASKIHSAGLKVELCDLPNGMTMLDEVEDAMIRGRLFAVVVTEQHVEHNSVTVDVLHGVAEEHRNMLLDDAVRLIANSYREYLVAKRANAKSNAAMELSKETADVLVPNERTQMLITRLARNQHLGFEELEEIITYLRQRQEGLRKDSNVVFGRNTAPLRKEESEDVKVQRNLEATIFSILKGEAHAQQQSTSAKATLPSSYQPSARYIESGEPFASSDFRSY